MTGDDQHQRIRVMVETTTRTFIGTLYMPVGDERFRLSDHLNTYDKQFICLSDVRVKDQGQTHRPGEERSFVAVALSSITFVAPVDE